MGVVGGGSRFLLGVGGLISRVGAGILGLQIVLSSLIEWVGFLVGVKKPTSGFGFSRLSWLLGGMVSRLLGAAVQVVGRAGLGWYNWMLVACLLLVGRIGKVGILSSSLWLVRRVVRLLWLGSASNGRVVGVGREVGWVGGLLLARRVCW